VVAKLALKMAQQRQCLRQAESRYGTLFASVPIGLYRATPDGQILDANPALAEMLRYPDQRALLTMSVADLYLEASDYQNWKVQMERHGVVRNDEAKLRTHDGGICWVANSARAIAEPYSHRVVYEGSLENVHKRKEAEEERERLIRELQDALATVKTLSGMLPICAACKKIRDDNGYWNQIEVFIQSHSDAEFTHSFCPECMRRLYPEVFEEGAKLSP
jgi:PAS domain S-box-containing protein